MVGMGSMVTKGLPRRVTVTGTPQLATWSQISENLALASNSPMTSMN